MTAVAIIRLKRSGKIDQHIIFAYMSDSPKIFRRKQGCTDHPNCHIRFIGNCFYLRVRLCAIYHVAVPLTGFTVWLEPLLESSDSSAYTLGCSLRILSSALPAVSSLSTATSKMPQHMSLSAPAARRTQQTSKLAETVQTFGRVS